MRTYILCVLVVILAGCAGTPHPQPRQESQSQPDDSPERSIEELKLVFERYAPAIHAAYRRALLRNPSLAGKAGYVFVITPSGAVEDPELAASSLNDTELEREISAVLLTMNFGPKGTKKMVVSWPVAFHPK